MPISSTKNKITGSKLVAVVVPLSNRAELTTDEKISLNHLTYFLGNYDKYIVVPESLKVDIPGLGIKRFSDKFFGSVAAHNKLMLSLVFYQTFSEYKYILIYHLDALVFSDQLIEWCQTDMDYIAPPWITKSRQSRPIDLSRCGNGGFSLRKVESFLRVINPIEQLVSAEEAWKMLIARRPRYQRYALRLLKYMMHLRYINRSHWVRNFYRRNEDRFWSDQAKLFYPNFSISSVDVGLRFAFDDEPRYCYEQNDYKLPFGCHGWNKYDRKFWLPYLLK